MSDERPVGPVFLTPDQVAKRLGLPKPPRELPSVQLGSDRRGVRYHRKNVEDWENGWRPEPVLVRPRPKWQLEEGFVYWIADDEDSPVKVGWTRGDAARRLHDIQIGCWATLRVHGQIEALRYREAEFHSALAEHRIRGEWFEREPTLAYFAPMVGEWLS